MDERIRIDSPLIAICPDAVDHHWFGRPGGWRHVSAERRWLVHEPISVVLERHVGRESRQGEVTVALEPGTRLRYDISDFYEMLDFNSVLVTYFFRVESGVYAGECVRMLDQEMDVRAPDTAVTPARFRPSPGDHREAGFQ